MSEAIQEGDLKLIAIEVALEKACHAADVGGAIGKVAAAMIGALDHPALFRLAGGRIELVDVADWDQAIGIAVDQQQRARADRRDRLDRPDRAKAVAIAPAGLGVGDRHHQLGWQPLARRAIGHNLGDPGKRAIGG